jgi:hypothetical protein
VDVEDEDAANRCAMEVTDRDGTREMPIATPDQCLWPPPLTDSDLKHPPDLIFSQFLHTF